MLFGLALFPTDYSISVPELARAAEDQGFESLLFPEHTHIPTSRRSPYPGGGELPKEYSHTLDPFVALSAAAAVTTTLKVGTGICLVIERDPLELAKQVASLDFLSNGRVLFGVGGGWNFEEMQNHGTDPATRWKVLRERILAMKEIWTKDEAEFHGRYVDFDPVWSWPKPAQKPHPPIIVGGTGEAALRRVVEWGDGWMPIPGRRAEFPLEELIPHLQDLARAKGRGPIPVTIFHARPEPGAIEHYTAMGVSRCVFMLPPAPSETVLPLVKQYSEVARQVA